MFLISIIIPFYDKDYHYIPNMLNYLYKLSFNKEVIFIDDRNDKNIDIRSEYNIPNEYKIIKSSINGENIGTFESRRTGTLNATGEYIWFVDVDDEPLDIKLETINQPIYDVIGFTYKIFTDSDLNYLNFFIDVPFYDIQYKKNEFHIVNYLISTLKIGLWNKLIKRNTLIEVFDQIPINKHFIEFEDCYLLYKILFNSTRVKLIGKPIYIYNLSEDRKNSFYKIKDKVIKSNSYINNLFSDEILKDKYFVNYLLEFLFNNG